MRQLLLWTGLVLPLLLVSVWLWNGYHLISTVDGEVQQATQAAALAAASQTEPEVSYDSEGDGTIQYVIDPTKAQSAAEAAFVLSVPGLTTTPVKIQVTGSTSAVAHEVATYAVPGAYAALLDWFQGRVTDELVIPVTETADIRLG